MGGGTPLTGVQREILNPDELAPPSGFNHGVLVDGGKTLYLAGQDASGPDAEIVAPDDLVGQFEQVLSNLSTVVEEAGGSSNDIVKLNVFVADRDEYRDHLDELGDVFGRYFDDYPAMALFEVADFFADDARIEMEGFAVVDNG